jgi:hypothetical protein
MIRLVVYREDHGWSFEVHSSGIELVDLGDRAVGGSVG